LISIWALLRVEILDHLGHEGVGQVGRIEAALGVDVGHVLGDSIEDRPHLDGDARVGQVREEDGGAVGASKMAWWTSLPTFQRSTSNAAATSMSEGA
jgi:hypothetical protein